MNETCGYNPSTDALQGPKCEAPAQHKGEHYYSDYDKQLYHVPTKADVEAAASVDVAVPAK